MGVIVGFDIGKDLGLRILIIDEAAPLKHLGFERADKRFGPGVVIRIGSRRHALPDACPIKEFSIGSAAILAASITVEDGTSINAA